MSRFKSQLTTSTTDLGSITDRLPLEIIAYIVDIAREDIESDCKYNSSKETPIQADVNKESRVNDKCNEVGLIQRIRLVCKDWANYFFNHGLYEVITIKSNLQCKQIMACWSKLPENDSHQWSIPSRLPRIWRLQLHNIRDHESLQDVDLETYNRTYLSMENVARLIDLFSNDFTELELFFSNCLVFPRPMIEAASKTKLFFGLTISIAIDGWSLQHSENAPLPTSSPPSLKPESLFEFLAGVSSLTEIRFVDWDIPFRFECPEFLPSTNISHLVIHGPYNEFHDQSMDFLKGLCARLVKGVKSFTVGMEGRHLRRLMPAIMVSADTLECLELMDGVDPWRFEQPFIDQVKLKGLKHLLIDSSALRIIGLFPPIWKPLSFVETLGIQFNFKLFRILNRNDAEMIRQWESIKRSFPNLKQIVFADPEEEAIRILLKNVNITLKEMRNEFNLNFFPDRDIACFLIPECDLSTLLTIGSLCDEYRAIQAVTSSKALGSSETDDEQ